MRLLLAALAAVGGIAALWPSAAIISWAMIRGGGFAGPFEGVLLAAILGPIGGALVTGAAWGLASHRAQRKQAP